MTEDEITKLLDTRKAEQKAFSDKYEAIQYSASKYHGMFKSVVKSFKTQEIRDSFFFFWEKAGELHLQYMLMSSPDAEFIATFPKFAETSLGKFIDFNNWVKEELKIDTDPKKREKK